MHMTDAGEVEGARVVTELEEDVDAEDALLLLLRCRVLKRAEAGVRLPFELIARAEDGPATPATDVSILSRDGAISHSLGIGCVRGRRPGVK